MKWITRERPKIDRIAYPWLISRFINPEAEIIFVPHQEVIEKAEALGAIPFDMPGAEYSHYGINVLLIIFLENMGSKMRHLTGSQPLDVVPIQTWRSVSFG